MKSGVEKVQSRMGDVVKAVDLATRSQVLVGVPSTTAGNRDGPINNAALAYIHDNGSPEANIPARPFMHPGIDDITPEIKERVKNIGKAAIKGRADAVDKGLNALGMVAASSIKNRINSNTPPPLAESTLAKRRARGVTRTNTLVDTGPMRNSITYVIRGTK